MPQQDDTHNCGAFLVAYSNAFVYHAPEQIHVLSQDPCKLLKRYSQRQEQWPSILTEDWFEPSNAAALRQTLRVEVLEGMISIGRQQNPVKWLAQIEQAADLVAGEYKIRNYAWYNLHLSVVILCGTNGTFVHMPEVSPIPR